VRVAEHTTTIAGVPVYYRSAESPQDGPPILYVHDALTSSDDLVPFLKRTGGLAPDLIGFGRSAKGGQLDYSPQGLVSFLEQFLDAVAVSRVSLVGHGWGGALGLLLAMRQPDLIERLVIVNAVPLLPGFTWHGLARMWRQAMLGELVMGATSRRQLARRLRRGSMSATAWDRARLDATWEQFDQGTQRALLRLHRSADESRLVELGADLGSLTIPILVLWGDSDPWFPSQLADAYGDRLRHAEVEHVPDAGHWPWLDQPRVLDVVADFLKWP
jgi:pimeloyl-ACP methyl ester carboxylesterase